jgi:hypothetical protein
MCFFSGQGYDAVDVIQGILELGGVPSIKMKKTFRGREAYFEGVVQGELGEVWEG